MTVTIERASNVIMLGRGSVAAEATGLAAISDRWIPYGSWRCYAAAPMGADLGRIVRTQEEISLRFDHFLSPTIQLTDLQDGRVRVSFEMFWPEGSAVQTGLCTRVGDVVRFEDEDSDRVAEMRKNLDGRLQLSVHQAGRTEEYSLLF